MGCALGKHASKAPAIDVATDVSEVLPPKASEVTSTGTTSPVSRQDYRDRHVGVTNPTTSVPEPPPAPKPGSEFIP